MTQSITRSLRRIFLCFAAVFVPFTLPAATINVPSAAAPTIQAGIDAASNGDTILVAPGTYDENIDFKGKAITVTSSGGAATTIIDGGRHGSTVVFSNGETRDSILSNMTVTGGQGHYNTSIGGIYIVSASPTIFSNIITENQCYGINSQDSSPLIQNNEISYTQAVPFECSFASGAGIWLFSYQATASSLRPEVIGNTIEQNTRSGLEDAGGNGGGGIAVWGGNPVIANNIIRNNATGRYFSPAGGGVGGGIYFAGDSGLVVNNLIYGNTSNLGGGGIFLATENIGTGFSMAILNNTIVDNAVVPVTTYSQSVVGGEQIYYAGGSNSAYTVDLKLKNNIIGGSTANPSVVCDDGTINPVGYSHNNFYNNGGPATGTYGGTCIYPSGTNGNISVDPAFVSDASQDFHLRKSSPGVDTGDNAVTDAAVALGYADGTDLDGNPRLQDAIGNGCTIDMGAYEYPGVTSDCSFATEKLTSSVNPSLIGQMVTFTAQLSAMNATPTGDVQFSDGNTVLGTVAVSDAGSATLSTSDLNIGSHTITAAYLPSGSLPSATATLTQVVNGYATTTSLISSLNPATVGQSVTFTASVTSPNGTPTGAVNFTDGTNVLGTSTLVNGVASFTASTLTIGTHAIAAAYNPGTTAFGASNTSLSQVINGTHTTTSLTVTPMTAAYGANIVMTSTVNLFGSPNYSGGISFLDGTTVIVTGELLPGSSTMSVNYAYLTVGIHSITAVYSGDATHNPSTSAPVTVTITSAVSSLSISATPNPAFALQPIRISAKLSGLPAGTSGNTINFLANGSVIGTAPTSAQGVATFTAALPSGTYTLTATFAGATGVSASNSSPVPEIVNPNPTTAALFAQPNPGYQGGNETLTASVGTLFASSATPPIPVGTVAFFDSGTLIGTANLDARGQATFSTNAFTVGRHALTANYLGTPNFLPATSITYTLAILPRDFTLTTDPTVTIQTEHHKDLNLTMVSIGDFIDTVVLHCTNLPAYATCTFPSNSQLLVAGATQTSSVHVDTDALLNYISSNVPASRPQDSSRLGRGVAYGLLLPVTLIATLRRRRKLRRAMELCIGLSVLLIATTFTGCSAHYPGHTPPGTYTFTVTGQGAAMHIIHTATVTLVVTQ